MCACPTRWTSRRTVETMIFVRVTFDCEASFHLNSMLSSFCFVYFKNHLVVFYWHKCEVSITLITHVFLVRTQYNKSVNAATAAPVVKEASHVDQLEAMYRILINALMCVLCCVCQGQRRPVHTEGGTTARAEAGSECEEPGRGRPRDDALHRPARVTVLHRRHHQAGLSLTTDTLST